MIYLSVLSGKQKFMHAHTHTPDNVKASVWSTQMLVAVGVYSELAVDWSSPTDSSGRSGSSGLKSNNG